MGNRKRENALSLKGCLGRVTRLVIAAEVIVGRFGLIGAVVGVVVEVGAKGMGA